MMSWAVWQKTVLGALLAAAASAFAEAGLPRCPVTISFALFEHGQIYSAVSDRGIDKDLVEELARRSGCRFEVVVKPRARIWHEIESGKLMMTGSGIPNETRRQFAWFITYAALKNYVMVRTTLGANSAQQFEANPELLLGAVRSYKHGVRIDEFLDRLRDQKRVVEEPDLRNVYLNFLRKRTDAIFVEPLVMTTYQAEMASQEPVRIEDWFPDEKPFRSGLVLSRRHFSDEDVKSWQRLISEMQSDGTLRRIFSRYLPAGQVRTMLDFKPD